MTSPNLSHLLPQLEEKLVSLLSALSKRCNPQVADLLESAGDKQTRPADRQALFSASAMLKVRQGNGSLHELLLEQIRRSERASKIADAERRAIVLLDEEDLETQILAQELATDAVAASGADYPPYLAMLKHVCPATWAEEELNPFSARAMSSLLINGLNPHFASPIVRSQLRAAATKVFAPEMAVVIKDLKSWLESQGVPHAGIAKSVTPAVPTEPFEADIAAISSEKVPLGKPTQAAQMAASLQGAVPERASSQDRALSQERALFDLKSADQLGQSAFANPQVLALAKVPTLLPVVEIERDAVAFAHSLGLSPYSRIARRNFFSKNKRRLKEAQATPGQLATVDVVAAMFDYVVDETRQPDAVRPLFWRLQQPALTLSLLDPNYLSDEPRSLRNLIENFGAISAAFSSEITRGSELFRRLETVVRAVEIVTSSLQTRSAVMARQIDVEYQKAAKSVTQLVEKIARERSALESTPERRNRRDYAARPSKEKERQVTENISATLDQKYSQVDVPSSVKDFLSNVWSRHLRTSALRDGEDSAEFKVAMQVVDDLLWSLNLDKRQQSRKELAQKIPPLIRLLTDGVKRVGAKEEEQKAFFDELFLVHLRKMTKIKKDTLRAVTKPPVVEIAMPKELFAGVGAGVPKLEEALESAEAPVADTSAKARLAPPTLPGRQEPVLRAMPGTLREMEALEKQGGDLRALQIPRFGENLGHTLPKPPQALSEQLEPLTQTRPNTLRIRTQKGKPAPGISPAPASLHDLAEQISPKTQLPSLITVPKPAKPKAVMPDAAVAKTSSAPIKQEAQLTEDDSAQLFEVMNAVDLSDCPPEDNSLDLSPAAAIDALQKDSWLRMNSRDGEVSMLKVAWINSQRSLALLVRFPDRRALSLRLVDLRKRIEEGQAALMGSPD